MDYAGLRLTITMAKELIDNEVERIKKSYGSKDEEINERLNEIEKEYVTLVLYRKP